MQKTLEEKLAFLKTCDSGFVVDAMNLLGLRDWWIEGILPVNTPTEKMVGLAFPAYYSRARKGEACLGTYQVLDQCPAGSVLVLSGINQSFLIGDNVVNCAQIKGLAGLVVETKNRDIEGIRELSIPVFSQGVAAKVLPSKFPMTFEANVPVEVGGGIINPGDVILGDSDGVICIPFPELDNVLYQLEKVIQVEQEAAQALKNPLVISDFSKIIRKKNTLRI